MIKSGAKGAAKYWEKINFWCKRCRKIMIISGAKGDKSWQKMKSGAKDAALSREKIKSGAKSVAKSLWKMKSGAIGVSKPFPNHSINPTVGVCGLRGLRSSPPNQCQVQRGAANLWQFRFFPLVLSSQVHIWSWGLGCWRSTIRKDKIQC